MEKSLDLVSAGLRSIVEHVESQLADVRTQHNALSEEVQAIKRTQQNITASIEALAEWQVSVDDRIARAEDSAGSDSERGQTVATELEGMKAEIVELRQSIDNGHNQFDALTAKIQGFEGRHGATAVRPAQEDSVKPDSAKLREHEATQEPASTLDNNKHGETQDHHANDTMEVDQPSALQNMPPPPRPTCMPRFERETSIASSVTLAGEDRGLLYSSSPTKSPKKPKPQRSAHGAKGQSSPQKPNSPNHVAKSEHPSVTAALTGPRQAAATSIIEESAPEKNGIDVVRDNTQEAAAADEDDGDTIVVAPSKSRLARLQSDHRGGMFAQATLAAERTKKRRLSTTTGSIEEDISDRSGRHSPVKITKVPETITEEPHTPLSTIKARFGMRAGSNDDDSQQQNDVEEAEAETEIAYEPVRKSGRKRTRSTRLEK